jgi:hypothetical protein
MSTKIQNPNNRLTYPGIAGPRFDTDIENLTQNLLEMVNILLGLPSNGFAILKGLDYDSGANTYNAGYVYMNGIIYYFAGTLAENTYLVPDITGAFNKLHSDGNSYDTYNIYLCVQSNSSVGSMPQFVGDMDQYRFNMTAMIGSTAGKVPVIGQSWDHNALAGIDSDGNIVSAIYVGNQATNVPVIESTFTPGQIVKVGSTGLVSDTPKDHYGSGVTDSNGYCHVVHNLNIPTDNQIIMLSLQTNAGDPSASWQGKTVNDFLIYTPGMYENIPINWHLHDTR